MTTFLAAVLSLKVIVILLVNGDFSVNAELSSSDLAVLGCSLSLGDGLVNLGLVSYDVLVWDGELTGTDGSLRVSRLG